MDIIRSLWIGDRLSAMEQLCIASFLRHGHPFHLYVYGDLDGVPPGTVLLDGNEVLPASRIFTYREYKTYAGFANFFRYKLLLEKGGWFVDADTICLKPFRFRTPYVFSSEGINGHQHVNLGAIKVPPRSAVMRYAWEACERMEVSQLKWSQCGPSLLREAAGKFSLEHHVRHWRTFCPVHYSTWEQLLDPAIEWSFAPGTYAIHLWNEQWRRWERNKDAVYPAGCLYEQLKSRYLQ